MCTYVHICESVVEWDPEKAAVNLQKHGIDFADAATLPDRRLRADDPGPRPR